MYALLQETQKEKENRLKYFYIGKVIEKYIVFLILMRQVKTFKATNFAIFINFCNFVYVKFLI